jgi:site-specific recombinase XerD
MIKKLFVDLESVYAPDIIKAYKSDFTHYQQWYQKNHHNALNIPTYAFVTYLKYIAKELTSATIQRCVVLLSQLYKSMSKKNINKEPEVLLAFKKITVSWVDPKSNEKPSPTTS